MLREVKPRNARTARILKAREPQPIESRKRTLLLHGPKCPQPLHDVLKTFHSLTRPHSVLLTKKNENIHPFENVENLEFLAEKNACGLVVWGSNSKKRPNAVTLLRIFNGKILEMQELLLVLPLNGSREDQERASGRERLLPFGVEMKPMILFTGSVWADSSTSEVAQTYAMIKSLFLDVFSGEEVRSMDVAGLQYLLMVAAGEPTESHDRPYIHLRWYKIRTKKSGQRLPRVELDPVGPKFNFSMGRTQLAEPGTMKEAMKKGKRLDDDFKSKQKNVDMDKIGDKVGRVHLSRQDLSELQLRKMKGLKRKAALSDEENQSDNMEVDDISEAERVKQPRLA